MDEDTRYEGRPFLRLLDCYVLRAIGQLDDAQAEALRAIEPKLAEVYGGDGVWHEVVASQMEFTDDIENSIAHVWMAAQMKAQELGVEVDAADFTRQFVDKTFL